MDVLGQFQEIHQNLKMEGKLLGGIKIGENVNKIAPKTYSVILKCYNRNNKISTDNKKVMRLFARYGYKHHGKIVI